MEKQISKLEEMKGWLVSTFSHIAILDELYLIGSILNSQSSIFNDIDIVQKIKFQNYSELKSYGETVNKIKSDFNEKFKIPLHVTTFTQNELNELYQFMSKNSYIKLL